MTVRIDTLRNQLATTVESLELVRAELEDLHVLAYDRPAAKERLGVRNGGEPDYALDTHGDRRAREAYRHLSEAAVVVAEYLTAAARDAERLLRAGDTVRSSRRDKSADVTRGELADALDAQKRRMERGEYSPVRRYPQAG